LAALLWGNVYYQDTYCGVLREETGGRYTFQYDTSYNGPAIAHRMPVRPDPYTTEHGLHPFFDNLVAEGWLAEAQSRLLGVRKAKPFELLLAFGHDCAGAVSVIDPSPRTLTSDLIDPKDTRSIAAYRTRASLSGIQPKLALINTNGELRPTVGKELSTHIAKFPSVNRHPDILENEYLSTLAFRLLLPNEPVVDLDILDLPDLGRALVIPRFDRKDGARLHFEEFTSLMSIPAELKYEADHADIANFILNDPACTPTDCYRILRRLLAGFIIGNTDMHLKNFSMMHAGQRLTLTPSYDQVNGLLYGFPDVALTLDSHKRCLVDLKLRNITHLAQQFQLQESGIEDLIHALGRRLPYAIAAVHGAPHGDAILKQKLTDNMEARWNGTFALIGASSSKKRQQPASSNI